MPTIIQPPILTQANLYVFDGATWRPALANTSGRLDVTASSNLNTNIAAAAATVNTNIASSSLNVPVNIASSSLNVPVNIANSTTTVNLPVDIKEQTKKPLVSLAL